MVWADLIGDFRLPDRILNAIPAIVLLPLRLHWALRPVAGAYVVLLLIGSVHLGWHYAIDGYVSIICGALN